MNLQIKKFRTVLTAYLIVLALCLTSTATPAHADDGRTGEDLSSLLFDSRFVLQNFSMNRAKNMCGAETALNAVHSLFKTRATTYAGDDQDPSETRNWSTLSGIPTSITIDWTPFSTQTSAGMILVRATITDDCTDKGPRALKYASVRFNIPVNIDSNGNFRALPPRKIQIDTVCCGNQQLTQTALFTPAGAIIRAPGTIYPPPQPRPKPPQPPSTGGSGNSSAPGTGSPSQPSPPPRPQTDPPPAPEPVPKPWTMENPCPECEDEKALVEHKVRRLAKFEKERNSRQAELDRLNEEINELQNDIERLEKQLESQEGIGAESLDPATGIRTTSYDQGDGTVVVKRIYPDGREQVVDTYSRRSTADIQKELAAKNRQLKRLETNKARVKKRIAALDTAIAKTRAQLKNAMEAFMICLELCNRKLGLGIGADGRGDAPPEIQPADTAETESSRQSALPERRIERDSGRQYAGGTRAENEVAADSGGEEYTAGSDLKYQQKPYSMGLPVEYGGNFSDTEPADPQQYHYSWHDYSLSSGAFGLEFGDNDVQKKEPGEFLGRDPYYFNWAVNAFTDPYFGASGRSFTSNEDEPVDFDNFWRDDDSLGLNLHPSDLTARNSINLRAELQYKHNWNSGYTYFNEDGNIDYDFNFNIDYRFLPPNPTLEDIGRQLRLQDNAFSFSQPETARQPRQGALTEDNWILAVPDDVFNVGGHRFTAETQAQPRNTDGNRFVELQQSGIDVILDFGSIPPDPVSHVEQAFRMLKNGGSLREIGMMIGEYYRNKGNFMYFSPSFLAAWETFSILEAYEQTSDIFLPSNYDLAVRFAVIAAGGSFHDADVMGFRAGSMASELESGDPDSPKYSESFFQKPFTAYYLDILHNLSDEAKQAPPPREYEALQLQFRYRNNLAAPSYQYYDWDQQISPDVYSDIDTYFPERSFDKMIDDFMDDYLNNDTTPPPSYSWGISNYPSPTAFGEDNMQRDPQETTVIPNDPLYREEEGSALGSLAKKGFGLALGVLGVGVQTNDSAADYQWGLHAIGLTPMGRNSGWDIYDGRQPNVVVAVIDSGTDLQHPDGPAHLWVNTDEVAGNDIDDDGNGYVDDIHGWNFIAENNNLQDDFGHGAFVAGIIAARSDNGIGIAGVNPGARIMTLKAANSNGSSRSLGIYRAIRYAVDNGAKIINISLGKKGLSQLEQLGINYAWNMGCLVVVAAGNQAGIVSEYGPPGANRAFAVASVNVDGKRRGTSNRGRTVAIAAPGEAIYSLTSSTGKRDGKITPISSTEYHRLDGTSFAAPYVSGVASLIWAKYPQLNNREVAGLLMHTAKDIGITGWDIRTGAGLVDARAALRLGDTPVPALQITDIEVGRDGSRVLWADLYGVVGDSVGQYFVGVAEGQDPDADEFATVCGPARTPVDHNRICRIPGDGLDGRRWTFRLEAREGGKIRHAVTMGFDRDGNLLD